MPRLNHSFNVMLGDQEFQDVGLLGAADGCSRAQVIRKLIATAARMRLAHIPYCVTGRPCLVPHLHVPPPADPRQLGLPVVSPPANPAVEAYVPPFRREGD